MAVYNEILVGRYNRYLQKLLGIKGGPPAASLAGDVMPVIPFYSGIESFIHQGWETFGLGVQVGAVAASTGKIQLRNPPGSNVVAVIQKIAVSTIAAVVFNLTFRVSSPALANLATVVSGTDSKFDNRGRRAPTCIVSSVADATAGAGVAVWLGAGTGPAQLDLITYENQEIVLLPDSSVLMVDENQNNGYNVTYWWRERFLEETERT